MMPLSWHAEMGPAFDEAMAEFKANAEGADSPAPDASVDADFGELAAEVGDGVGHGDHAGHGGGESGGGDGPSIEFGFGDFGGGDFGGDFGGFGGGGL